MRYFFSLARPEPALSIRITVPATARCTVAFGRAAQRGGSCMVGAAIGAINIAVVAATTDNDLTVAMSAVKQPGTGVHRYARPMRAGV